MNLSAAIRHITNYASDPLAVYESAMAGRGGMSPPLRRFHESKAGDRAVIAPNQSGKSFALAAECHWQGEGRHPFRDVTDMWGVFGLVVANLDSGGWTTFSDNLRQLQRPNALHDECRYIEGRGYFVGSQRGVRWRDGRRMVVHSGTQEVQSLAGHRWDMVGFEEVPRESHWGEASARVAVSGGPRVCAFTPIGREVTWFRRKIEGLPDEGVAAEEPGWFVERFALTPENVPHRDPESLRLQIARTPPWERAQRIYGEWEGVNLERWIEGYSEANIIDDEYIEGLDVLDFRIGWDHGERPGAQVGYLAAWTGRALYVLEEVSSTARSSPTEDAAAMHEAMKKWGVGFHHVAAAVGDSNSAGKMGAGLSVNAWLEREFARIAKTRKAPFRIDPPFKGPGTVRARAHMLNIACLQQALYVHRSCRLLDRALKNWMGRNDDYKHHIDALGYLASTVFDGPGGGPGRMVLSA